MPTPRRFAHALIALPAAVLACTILSPGGGPATEAVPPIVATATEAGAAEATTAPSTEVNATPTDAPTRAPATDTATAVPTVTPQPTAKLLAFEVVQTQIWDDAQGNTRTNVLLHNPYDFPVVPAYRASGTIFNAAGDKLRNGSLYFWDGISGGRGFALPGETVAANICFTCEAALLDQPWASVEFGLAVKDASQGINFVTAVTGTVSGVSFAGATFDIAGTATNLSDASVQRLSLRVIVYDQAGQLVGAGEASAYDVPAGGSASVSGYGIGQPPAGPITYEFSALGVNY